jgi:Uma2 family endonuclease
MKLTEDSTMSSAASKTYLSPQQYLALKRASDIKHEHYRGEMFAMAGAGREHNLIVVNVTSELRNQLRDRQCEVYAAAMRVFLPPTEDYAYPDVVVACGEPQFMDDAFDTLLNPILIVEVLSESTKDFDRGSKFAYYRQIPSLREFVAISQEQVWVEHHRLVDREWKLVDLVRRRDFLRLESVGCEISLSEVYAKVAAEESGDVTGNI